MTWTVSRITVMIASRTFVAGILSRVAMARAVSRIARANMSHVLKSGVMAPPHPTP